ncbi:MULTISPECIES: TetR/AcrR family transcriptional regulator [unclassified Streptomyces]|uniref:TetR/AcrR family transcriptional regulator n=1 Tax=unclassified Streptomyces TaxID=2593676 RepID=UPI000DC348EA|nr:MULTISPECIES: TetR/AcrR family transcriptional regulator [unclassified Streptomyces]MYU07558.1 TetR family transcriptional regulator [Streptomyces sp. SID8366]MYU66172.1 TetR family transcriptional regulator [Streptomyces sp. SID69]RAJ60266.1 TetR family transcriptional regulator [Streptomyces sp. PsTaAH-130]
MAKQARSRRTHELVLDAAAAEFVRHGYPRANLQHVAARTGLTKGALYAHFASKEHLARTLTDHLDQVVDEVLARHAAEDLPAYQRLRALSCTLAERIESDVRFNAALRLVMDEAASAPEPPRLLSDLRALAAEAVASAGSGGVPAERLSTESLADLATVILIGSYCTAPDPERSGLAERVRDLWDAVGAVPQAADGTASR